MAAGPGENQMKVFKALDEEMVRLFEEATPEALDKSDHIAKILLGYAELPLGLRCRACIVLAGFDEPGYVEWAEQAVHWADLAWNETAEHSEAECALRQRAHDCLDQAKEYFEEHGGYHYDQEQEDDKPECEDVRLVSSCRSTVGPDGTVTTTVHKAPAADPPAVEEQPKAKKIARIDSGTGRIDIQDPETLEWETVDEVRWEDLSFV